MFTFLKNIVQKCVFHCPEGLACNIRYKFWRNISPNTDLFYTFYTTVVHRHQERIIFLRNFFFQSCYVHIWNVARKAFARNFRQFHLSWNVHLVRWQQAHFPSNSGVVIPFKMLSNMQMHLFGHYNYSHYNLCSKHVCSSGFHPVTVSLKLDIQLSLPSKWWWGVPLKSQMY